MRLTTVMAALLASFQWGPASLVEIIWTCTGLVGLYFTWDNLRDARKYITALRKLNGRNLALAREMKVIAFGHYRNEIIRIVMFGVIIGIGVTAMITPAPSATRRQPVTPVGIAITLGLFTLTGLLVAASALDRRQRDLMLEIDPRVETPRPSP